MANNQIALLSQAPQLDTPYESQGKALQLRQLMNQGQVQDMDMQDRRQKIADDAGMRGVFATDDATPDKIKSLYKINPRAAQAFEKAQGEIGETAAKTNQSKEQSIETHGKSVVQAFAVHRDQINTVNDPQTAAAWMRSIYSDPLTGPIVGKMGNVEDAIARIPSDPAGFANWKLQAGLHADDYVKRTAAVLGTRDLGSTTQNISTDPVTGKVTVNDTNAKTQTPDSVASVGATVRGQNLVNQRALDAAEAGKNQIVQSDNGPVLVNTRTGAGRTVMGADGQPLPGVTKPLNDSQSKALLFGTRMQEADKVLSQLATEGTTTSVPGSRLPVVGGAINAMSSGNRQMLDQAKRDFMNAVLRRESGAAISAGEFDSADKQYFPQVGDGPEVVSQKAKNRSLAINGVLVEVPEKQRASITPGAKAAGPSQVTDAASYAKVPSGAEYVTPDGHTRRKP